MTSDLKARLDAMVWEKMGDVSRSHPITSFELAWALGHVALDLLQERDALKDKLAAAEAKVKALEDADAHALCAKLRASQAREWELRQKLFRSDCNAMGEGWGHTLCAEQRDAAEAKVKELEEQLAEADHCIAWMADPGVGTDPRYMGRLANMRGMAAQDAAIEREEARKKGAEHVE